MDFFEEVAKSIEENKGDWIPRKKTSVYPFNPVQAGEMKSWFDSFEEQPDFIILDKEQWSQYASILKEMHGSNFPNETKFTDESRLRFNTAEIVRLDLPT